MALSEHELDLIAQLHGELRRTYKQDVLLRRYYRLKQRVEQLGMAIPPSMRQFLVIANWPRVVVDTINARQQLRAMMLPGEATADPRLLAIAEANNLRARLKMFNRDRMVFGRGFFSVGANEANDELPLIRSESPMNLAALVDQTTETMLAAGRFLKAGPRNTSPAQVTLMLPEQTVTAAMERGRWVETDRDPHELGVVPIIMHLNRRMSGEWEGESELTDIIPLTDAAARSMTNLQFAQEAHGVPKMFMTGVAQGEFVDEDGKPIPMFEAYYDALTTLTNKDAKVGQLTAADLKNFETALKIYGTQASTVTGFPGRYFGLTSVNPPSADGIRAEEAELVRSAEDQNDEVGMSLGWTGGLALRFATGEWVEDQRRVQCDWFDPATPTVAQRTDAMVKLRQTNPPSISREGMWDEMGWSEARKARERKYLADEVAEDPDLAAARALTGASS